MATSCHLLNHVHVKGGLLLAPKTTNARISGRFRRPGWTIQRRSATFPVVSASFAFNHVPMDTSVSSNISNADAVLEQTSVITSSNLKPLSELFHNLSLADLDPGTAKLAIGLVGPALSAFGFLFILRIVMSWYPKIPLGKFPYVIAYAPTEPILVQTRKLIPPVGGVDVTPVVWFGLVSFLNEILVGPQGLLVLVSQQQVS